MAAATQLLGAFGGAVGGAVESNGALDDLKASMREEDAEHRRLLARQEVDDPENAGIMRRMQEMQRERYNQARATNVVAGGTDAHLAAMQQLGGDIVARTGQGIAQRATAKKDAQRKDWRASKRQNAQQMFGIRQNRAQAIANAAGQTSKAAAGIMAASGTVDNPFGMFGLSQGDYERMAQANVDAATEASVAAQLENSLNETLDELKKQGY